VSSEIKEIIDATTKEAGVSEVPSEMVVALAKQTETQVSVQTESTMSGNN
jgi:hypothetical protein